MQSTPVGFGACNTYSLASSTGKVAKVATQDATATLTAFGGGWKTFPVPKPIIFGQNTNTQTAQTHNSTRSWMA